MFSEEAVFKFIHDKEGVFVHCFTLYTFCQFWQCATFVESILYMSQKSTGELYVITLKNDAKFDEELTCALKNDMRYFENFDPTLESLKICTLMGTFWPKYMMFELKNYRGVTCHEHWRVIKNFFLKKMTGGLKNDIRNLVNFNVSSRKSENLHFDGLLLSRT